MLAVLLVMAPVAHAMDSFVGVARDVEGALLYREQHWRFEDGAAAKHVVLYSCPDGAAFARKVLDAVADPAAPDFAFVDGRDGYEEGVRRDARGRVVYWRAAAGEPLRTARLPDARPLVIDAGFDEWVRDEWPTLLTEGAIEARFVVPSHLEAIPVRIRMAAADGSTVRLILRVDRWFGAFVGETAIDYDAVDRELRAFEGVGNVRSLAGARRRVRIDFPPELRGSASDRQAIAAALAAPLTGRCGC
ncbi:MAG TPA: hypothetical protein VI258_04615 [Rhodanobacteraceae bacterium]